MEFSYVKCEVNNKYIYCRGTGGSVGIATELRARRSGNRTPVWARFSAPVHTGPGAHPVSCTMGTGSFPGGKERPGRDADPSPSSSAVGHERVELYLYSPYGPYGLYRASVPVQGWPLPHFTLPVSTHNKLWNLYTMKILQSDRIHKNKFYRLNNEMAYKISWAG